MFHLNWSHYYIKYWSSVSSTPYTYFLTFPTYPPNTNPTLSSPSHLSFNLSNFYLASSHYHLCMAISPPGACTGLIYPYLPDYSLVYGTIPPWVTLVRLGALRIILSVEFLKICIYLAWNLPETHPIYIWCSKPMMLHPGSWWSYHTPPLWTPSIHWIHLSPHYVSLCSLDWFKRFW